MKLIWTDPYVIFLIDKVQSAEYIWNYRCPSHKNKLKKQIFWRSLVDELNTCFEPNVPFEYSEVIRKWNNLKSYYTAEKQKLFRAEKSGASSEDLEIISSAWKFQQNMNFLSSTVIFTPSVNNFNKRSLEDLRSFTTNGIGTNILNSQPATVATPSFLRISSPLTLPIKDEAPIEFIDCHDTQLAMPPSDLSSSLPSPHAFSQRSQALTVSPPDLSTPLPSPPAMTPRSEVHTCSPMHPKKRQKITKENDSPVASLIKRSNELSEALIRRFNCAPEDRYDTSPFGNCIAYELSKLDEDLKLEGKRRIFNIVWDIQAEQLQRKVNKCTT